MADIADRASALEEMQREHALQAQQQRIDASMRGSQGGRADCADCGELIDPERRRALPFTNRCTECSAAVELRLRTAQCRT